jgi:hypothetical protein
MAIIIIDVVYFTIIIIYLNVLDSGCKYYSCIINMVNIESKDLL